MSKTRVGSKFVRKLLNQMGANKKRNVRAFKVVVGNTTTYFEDGKPANSFASRRCKLDKVPAKVFENLGNEQYILLATYEIDTNALKDISEFKEIQMPQSRIAKGANSIEAWAFALTYPNKVATMVRSRAS